MCRYKEKATQPEADKSDEICRFFLFAANHNEKKKWSMKIGNGDYDFGVRPTNILQGF